MGACFEVPIVRSRFHVAVDENYGDPELPWQRHLAPSSIAPKGSRLPTKREKSWRPTEAVLIDTAAAGVDAGGHPRSAPKPRS